MDELEVLKIVISTSASWDNVINRWLKFLKPFLIGNPVGKLQATDRASQVFLIEHLSLFCQVPISCSDKTAAWALSTGHEDRLFSVGMLTPEVSTLLVLAHGDKGSYRRA